MKRYNPPTPLKGGQIPSSGKPPQEVGGENKIEYKICENLRDLREI